MSETHFLMPPADPLEDTQTVAIYDFTLGKARYLEPGAEQHVQHQRLPAPQNEGDLKPRPAAPDASHPRQADVPEWYGAALTTIRRFQSTTLRNPTLCSKYPGTT